MVLLTKGGLIAAGSVTGGGGGGPTLWLASSAALPGGMTLTRAGSTATYLSGASYAAATYQTASADAPRFERLPSAKIGYMAEGARTILNLRSLDITDAAWSALNGATKISGEIVELVGVSSMVQQYHADAGIDSRTFTISSRLRSNTTITRIVLAPVHGGVAAWESPNQTITTDFDLYRFTQAFGGGGGHGIYTGVQAGSTGTGTDIGRVEIDAIQVEEGPFGSSMIDAGTATGNTTTTTRNADVTAQTVTHSSGGFAVAFEARTAAGKAGDQYLWCRHADASNWCAIKRNSSGAIVAEMRSGGTTVSITGATVADLTEFKVSASFNTNDLGLAVNSTAATRVTTAAYPSGLVSNVFGHDRAGASSWFGHIISGPDGATWPSVTDNTGLIALNA